MSYIKVTYPIGNSFIRSTFEDNSTYIKTSVNSTFIKVAYDGGSEAIWGGITGTLSNQIDLQNALNAKVPYTGATADVNLGEYGINVGNVIYDTTPTGIPTEQGATYWDTSAETVALIMNGTIQKIGEDTFYHVRNTTGSTIPKGTAVRFSGTTGNSGRLLIAPMLANGTYPSQYYMGITSEELVNNADGKVYHFGKMRNINTSAFNDGDVLYVSPSVAGGLTATAPIAPNNIIIAAAVVHAANNGTLMIRTTLGSNINADEGVLITTPTANQGLFYDSGLWVNKSISTALGYTPANAATTLTINGVTFDISSNRSWTIAAGISGSGTSGQVSYWTGASSLGGSNNFFWDAANNRLGIGTNTPGYGLEVISSARFASRATINTGTINAMVLSVGTTFTGNLLLVQGSNGSGYFGIDGTGAWGWNDGSLTINAHTANRHVIVGTQGVEIARFTSGKNILVNTTADDGVNKLQVSGSAKFTSDILVNGINIGLGAGNVASNLRFGGSALLSNTTGAGNVALGYAAMYYNLNGSNNMAIGVQALVGNSSGDNNVAVGTAALFGNFNGYNNVAIGHWAAYDSVGSLSNTVGANNIFIGYGCLGESGIESNRTWIGNATTTSTWLGGNLLLGTRTNGGQRLQVVGSSYFKTAGNTSATTGFQIQNSTPSTIFEVRDDGNVGIGGAALSGYKLRVYGNIWASSFDQLNTLAGSSGVGAITFYDQGTLTMSLYGPHAAESVKGFFTLRSQGIYYTTPTGTLLHADADFADHPTLIIRSRNTAADSIFFANYHYTLGALFSTVQPAGGNSDITFRPNRTNKFVISATGTYAASVIGNLSVNGNRVNLSSLPTSSAGLSAGDIWNDAGTLKIV